MVAMTFGQAQKAHPSTYRQGKRAFHANKRLSDNPHRKRTHKHAAWARGWENQANKAEITFFKAFPRLLKESYIHKHEKLYTGGA